MHVPLQQVAPVDRVGCVRRARSVTRVPRLEMLIMQKRHPLVEDFEREAIRNRDASYQCNLRIFEALYREARQLGVLPPRDPLEGIEQDIRLASILNVRHATGTDRPGPR